jgi:hypothetical protein
LNADKQTEKSLIPCLEPCALLLEFARKSVRLEQAEQVELAVDDAVTVMRLIEHNLQEGHNPCREADFSDPLNTRRLLLLLKKLEPVRSRALSGNDESK